MDFQPIGVIKTPYSSLQKMPVQPAGADGVVGHIELNPELTEGLQGLSGFSHIIVLYHFHQSGSPQLRVIPFLDKESRGLFATRAPNRPNPIGLSVLKLISIEGSLLRVENVDILNGTPLLDIKPYVPSFDQPSDPVRSGWLERSCMVVGTTRSDRRFVPKT